MQGTINFKGVEIEIEYTPTIEERHGGESLEINDLIIKVQGVDLTDLFLSCDRLWYDLEEKATQHYIDETADYVGKWLEIK